MKDFARFSRKREEPTWFSKIPRTELAVAMADEKTLKVHDFENARSVIIQRELSLSLCVARSLARSLAHARAVRKQSVSDPGETRPVGKHARRMDAMAAGSALEKCALLRSKEKCVNTERKRRRTRENREHKGRRIDRERAETGLLTGCPDHAVHFLFRWPHIPADRWHCSTGAHRVEANGTDVTAYSAVYAPETAM